MKKNSKGFSLIELLIIITIILILALGASKMNFNPSINKQNSLMFSNDVYSNIEKIRNNAILGKGIGSGTFVYPDKWIIKISTGGTSGTIRGYYFLSGGTLQDYSDFKVNFINQYSKISKLICYDIKKTNPNIHSNIDIEITGNAISLSGCTIPNNKILDIETNYKNFKKIVRINTINGIIEKVDN